MELHKMTTTQTNKPITKSAKIRAYIAKHPTATASVVAKSTGADVSLVYEIKKQQRKANSTGDTLPKVAQQTKVETAPTYTIGETNALSYDAVVDIISDYKLNFNQGSAVAGIFLSNLDMSEEEKNDNLQSALWFLRKELNTRIG
jgi:hypothetical protein